MAARCRWFFPIDSGIDNIFLLLFLLDSTDAQFMQSVSFAAKGEKQAFLELWVGGDACLRCLVDFLFVALAYTAMTVTKTTLSFTR